MEKHTFSRRKFIKGAAASVIGVATMGLVDACSPKESADVPLTTGGSEQSSIETISVTSESLSEPSIPESTDKELIDYEVINCDLIIIGSGNGAVSAAKWAISQGKKVTIIDKGPYGFSGVSGYNWDLYLVCVNLEGGGRAPASEEDHFVNAKFANKAYAHAPWSNEALHFLQRGEVLPARNEDGTNRLYFTLEFPGGGGSLTGIEGIYFRADTDVLKESSLLTIADRTMATDLVISDGRCVGVSCLYLPTGDYRVYRAPATIMATGASCQFYGWTGVSSYSINAMDNTSDLDMAAFRRGAGIGHSEFSAYDYTTSYPKGLGFGWGTCIDADGNEPGIYADKNGNQLFDSEVNFGTMNRATFNQTIANRILTEDIATEDGELMLNLKGHKIRHCAETNIPLFERFGIDIMNELIPIHSDAFERLGTPIIDENGMTEFPGLFAIRGAGSVSPLADMPGGGTNMIYGPYVAQCAIEYSRDFEVSAIDWTTAEEEFSRLQELLTKNVENALRPFEIRHAIQELCGKCWGPIRYEEELKTAAEELERIRKEDLPHMCVSTSSKTYNTEWKDAIETTNLLDTAELAVKASLLRKETRGQYVYVDYPDTDDENWNCTLVGHLTDSGIEFEKKSP